VARASRGSRGLEGGQFTGGDLAVSGGGESGGGGLAGVVVRQRLVVLVGALALAVAGALAWLRLPVDAFPDVTNVQVMVLSEAEGLAPLDVEQQVTFPLEAAMGGLPSVEQVRSLSKPGLSQVVVVFQDDVDVYFARQQVFERLQGVVGALPPGVAVELGPVSTGLGEVFQYTLRSDRHSLTELRTLQDWVVAPRLRALPGVTEVNGFGGRVRQVDVVVQPQRLLAYDLTLGAVLDGLRDGNANAGGGFLERGGEQTWVRSLGLAAGLDDLRRIVLAAPDGVPVTLGDVAEVREGHQTRQGMLTRDGAGETVGASVIMRKGANAAAVVVGVRAALPGIQAALPDGVTVDVFYDRTTLVEASVATVGQALLLGGVFVVAVLFLFLGSLRAAALVALSLPLTALFAFVLMDAHGVTANLMSLGGLAIAIGMVVDASIVVTENLARHRALAGPQADGRALAAAALREVARPILFAVLVIVIVFVPLLALEGMEGKLFGPLALTMVFALTGSLVVAFTVVPALGSLVVRAPRARPSSQTPAPRLRPGAALRRGYERLLRACFRHRAATLVLALGVLGVAAALAPRLGTGFLPELDEGALAINAVRLPSAGLEGSAGAVAWMEERLRTYPEVETVVTKTGRPEISEDPMGPEQSDVLVMLRPADEWPTRRPKAELVAALAADLGRLPGQRLAFSQPIALRVNELVSGVKSDLAVKLFGPDLDVLRARANDVAAVLAGVPGAADVKVETTAGFRQLEVVPDRGELARWGLSVAAVNDLVEAAVGGRRVSTLIEGERRFAIQVRYPLVARGDPEALARLLVATPSGARVPLARLATIREVEAPAQVSRENGMRRIVVEANVRGRDLGGFVADARERLAGVMDALPDGYWPEYGGTFENQQRAMARLSVVVPLSLLLIFVLLLAAFGSLRDAALVLVNLPFALAGGVASLVAFDVELSVSAVIGFIALFGIAVENGTVLVSFIRQLRAAGLPAEEAVVQAAGLRLRALAMTAATTLAGLLPLLLATGPGAELQRPLAIVMGGGLVTATLLTLIVLPTLYAWVDRRRPAPAPAVPPPTEAQPAAAAAG
jgi:cobalt-zinc-cadmium resistance protein CzcA